MKDPQNTEVDVCMNTRWLARRAGGMETLYLTSKAEADQVLTTGNQLGVPGEANQAAIVASLLQLLAAMLRLLKSELRVTLQLQGEGCSCANVHANVNSNINCLCLDQDLLTAQPDKSQ